MSIIYDILLCNIQINAILPILNHLYGQAPKEPGSKLSVAVDGGKRVSYHTNVSYEW